MKKQDIKYIQLIRLFQLNLKVAKICGRRVCRPRRSGTNPGYTNLELMNFCILIFIIFFDFTIFNVG